MGESGVLLASQPYDWEVASTRSIERKPASLFYRPFKSHSISGDWTLHLPNKNETPTSLSAGFNWLCCATSHSNLYILNPTGFQEDIISVPGQVVTTCGRGRLLAVVFAPSSSSYHPLITSTTEEGEERSLGEAQTSPLQGWVLDMVTKERVCAFDLPLSPFSSLAWLSFAPHHGSLLTMDSAGIVRVLVPQYGFTFQTLMDTKVLRKVRTDSFWPISFSRKQTLIGVELRGNKKAPDTTPRPVTSSIPLALPFLLPHSDLDVELSLKRLEVQLLSSPLARLESNESEQSVQARLEALTLEMDKVHIRAIKECCEQDKLDKAIQHAAKIHNTNCLQLAMKIANHFSMTLLATRIEEFMTVKEQLMEEQEEEEEEVRTPSTLSRQYQEEEEEEEEVREEAKQAEAHDTPSPLEKRKIGLAFTKNQASPLRPQKKQRQEEPSYSSPLLRKKRSSLNPFPANLPSTSSSSATNERDADAATSSEDAEQLLNSFQHSPVKQPHKLNRQSSFTKSAISRRKNLF
jgi:hypothetical protein